MRIVLDATYSVGRHLSGIGVYSQEILSRLPVAHPGPRYLFGYRPHQFFRGLRATVPCNVSRTLLWKDWPLRVDLFHGLNQRVDSKRFRRVVTTFHDLFVISGDYSTPEFRARFAAQARSAAERSDLIIAVSEFTANQVHTILGIPRSRIRVVHHGANPAPRSSLSDHLILFVGALQKRKNVLRLVQAFEQSAPGWKLVLAGSAGYGANEIFEAIQNSPRKSDIELPGYVSSEALQALYRRASIFAFPSLDEGFGIPALEAMAHGIPVLTSQASAMEEFCGGAAVLVDPLDVNSIGLGLNKLTRGADYRRKLADQGVEQSAQFSWGRTVEKTWGVYKELID